MKKSIAFLVLLLLLIYCSDASQQPDDLNFLKGIGEKITTDDAYRWAARFNNSKGSKTQSFSVEVSDLANIVAENESIGITFHFAFDVDGALHILLIPVVVNKSVWDSETIIDTNTSLKINRSTAGEWIQNFTLRNPQLTRSHFFGLNVFTEILSDDRLQQIVFVQGIDDSGKSQLMIYALRTSVNENGRQSGEDVTVYDKSTTCPTHCDDYQNIP